MAPSVTRFSWWWLAGKEREQVSNGSSINSLSDWGIGLRGEPEGLKFTSVKGANSNSRMPPSSWNRKLERKWKSREERSRMIEKEYDVVLVPSDGDCLLGPESDDSDWSIGWLEPHAPDFQSDDETDDSFAVIVPCYKHDCNELEGDDEEGTDDQILNAIRNLSNQYSAEGKRYMEQWLSSFNSY